MIFQGRGEINPIHSQHLVLIIYVLPTVENQDHKITSSSAQQRVERLGQRELLIYHSVPSVLVAYSV